MRQKGSRYLKLFSSHAISQLVIGLVSLARIPIAVTHSETNAIAAWFFALHLMAWIPVISANQINLTRDKVAKGGRPVSPRMGSKSKVLIAISVLAIAVFLNIGVAPTKEFFLAILVSLPLLAILALIQWKFAWTLGYLLGNSRQLLVNSFTIVGSLLSLLLIIAFTSSPFWKTIGTVQQTFYLLCMSILTSLLPILIASTLCLAQRIRPEVYEAVKGSDKMINTASLMPPAMLSGFDTLILAILATPSDLVLYGIYARYLLTYTILPNSLYVELMNDAKFNEQTTFKLKRINYFMILNLPFIVIGLSLENLIMPILTADNFEYNPLISFLMAIYGFILLPWYGLQSKMLNNDSARDYFGTYVLRYLFPSSLIMSMLLTSILGFEGTFITMVISYIWAYFVLNRALKKL